MSTSVTAVSADQLGIVQGEEFDQQLDYDLGHLLACYPSIPDDPGFKEGSEESLLGLATRATQSLVRHIFSLPSESTEDGRFASLPRPQLVLPRAKPVPKPKAMTKWEKFAQEKGIVKKKRSKLVFDETEQDWKRRHGYKRGNDEAAVPIIEASGKDQAGEDPFTRLEREKRERVKQNRQSEARNVDAATPSGAVPSSVKLTTKLDANAKRGQIAKGKAMKADIANASYLAGVSTASLGKFDKRLKGEKGARKLPGARQKHLPLDSGGLEGAMVSKVMGKVVRQGETQLVNERRAIGNLEAQKRDDKSHAKRASGGDDESEGRRKKGRQGRVKNRRVPKKAPAAKAGVQKKGSKAGKGRR